MARPFGHSNNSEKQEKKNDVQTRNCERKTTVPPRAEEERSGSSSELHDRNTASAQSTGIPPNVYCIPNSSFLNCPSFINGLSNGNTVCDASTSSKENCETGQRTEVIKGVFTSNRTITSEDIQIVAGAIKEDWKNLLKKLPGVTSNNLSFHQEFINAMDRKDSTNMTEITLFTWKSVLPGLSTIGNLSKALFSIGHPDIVTCLKP